MAINNTIGINDVYTSENWGVTFHDYSLTGDNIDLQDLMVAVSEWRASSVETEIVPLTSRIKIRNQFLDKLGTALSELTSAEATLPSDAKGTDRCSFTFSAGTRQCIADLPNHRWTLDDNEQKKYLEYFIQLVKSRTDSLNNASETDMSRLQSLVNRRDEAFSTASELMSSISETRSNLIRNL